MAQKKLLTNGTASKCNDGRWHGTVWYLDKAGERMRRAFSGVTKREVEQKMKEYTEHFYDDQIESDEVKRPLKEGMQRWLEVFKLPSIERTTYDRYECTARHQIYPYIGDIIVEDVTAADVKSLMNRMMNEGYAYTTVKKVHNLLNEYYKSLTEQELITRSPMTAAPMMKKANFMAAQDKENLPTCETVTVFTDEELDKFKAEAFSLYGNGVRKYMQASAFTLLLNTGLRTGELLGLLNSDVDLDNRVIHVQRGVKEVYRRDGSEIDSGREVKVGKLKSATSKRDVPLNDTAIEAIKDLRKEFYFGEDTPLVCDQQGKYTRPVNFRKRYYKILKNAGIEQKGLHSFRHTFASRLVNGVKQPDGSLLCLSPKQVADLLGHSTSEITEMYYVKRDNTRLVGITDGFAF